MIIHTKKLIHPIFFGNIAGQLLTFLSKNPSRQIFLLCDENSEAFCLPLLSDILKKIQITGQFSIPAGEQHKTLQSCEKVWEAMLEARIDRNALLVNLGGGVVGDLGGFCAASWKRGIGFVHIPTTLLAMTDAALGGKTGVDFKGVKNIIGAFQQPEAVFVDARFLKTLPKNEVKSGMAEVVKHAYIAAPSIFEILKKMDKPETANWAEILRDSIAVKMQVVAQDEKENGLRKVLNFGHTIGHAIEAFSHQIGKPISHGHAVALGMVAELKLVESGSQRCNDLERFVEKHYTQFPISKENKRILWDLMKNDKKNTANEIRFVVPGEAAFTLLEQTLKIENLDF